MIHELTRMGVLRDIGRAGRKSRKDASLREWRVIHTIARFVVVLLQGWETSIVEVMWRPFFHWLIIVVRESVSI